MITEEVKEKNLNTYVEKLKGVGVDITPLIETGIDLKNASFTHSNEYGNAYQGSLIVNLFKLTAYAVNINEKVIPKEMRVDKNTLVKVCLLHHIAKAVRLIPNDNQWEVEKRGFVFKYDNNQPSIRTGLHSLILAQSAGVTFTPEEAEAMTINDREMTDDQARWHSSLMATIVRMANELTYAEINKR